MAHSQKKGLLQLDPRTKLLLLILFNIAIFTGYDSRRNLIISLLPMLLMALEGERKRALFLALICQGAGLALQALGPRSTGGLLVFIQGILFLFYGLMPLLAMGAYVMSSTSPSEFAAAMVRMRIPRKIIIPFMVLFRFFPTIREERQQIKLAMRMRGISLGGGKASKILEYRLIPLLMSLVKIGEELTAAAMTRCIDAPGPKTSIYPIGFHWQDALVLLVSLGLILIFK